MSNIETYSLGASTEVPHIPFEIIIENLAVHHEGKTLASMNVICRFGHYSLKFIGVTVVAKERGVTIDFPWTYRSQRWEPVVDANQAIRKPLAVAVLKAYQEALAKFDRKHGFDKADVTEARNE